MTTLEFENLHAGVRTENGLLPILHGVDLRVESGSVAALMGPNGSGKSTLANVLMGHPRYEVTQGAIQLDGIDITQLPTHERARLGLFVTLQYPVSVPGVPLSEVLAAGNRRVADTAILEALEGVQLDPTFADRGLNVEFSGGEMKRVEAVQLMLSESKIAVLDEIDSGLDVDAVEVIAEHVRSTVASGLGVLVVSHYRRLLDLLQPETVHVFRDGRIVGSGSGDLIEEIDSLGYDPVIAGMQ